MKKSLELKKTSVEPVNKNVDQLKEELEAILPQSENPIVTVQMGETSISIPIPFDIVKASLKTIGMKNRTILEMFGIKVALDVP